MGFFIEFPVFSALCATIYLASIVMLFIGCRNKSKANRSLIFIISAFIIIGIIQVVFGFILLIDTKGNWGVVLSPALIALATILFAQKKLYVCLMGIVPLAIVAFVCLPYGTFERGYSFTEMPAQTGEYESKDEETNENKKTRNTVCYINSNTDPFDFARIYLDYQEADYLGYVEEDKAHYTTIIRYKLSELSTNFSEDTIHNTSPIFIKKFNNDDKKSR